MKKNLLSLNTLVFLMFFAVGTTFQNCSRIGFLNSSKPSDPIPLNHPPTEYNLASSTKEISLIDQKGVQTFLSEIFINDGVSDEGKNNFSKFFAAEIIPQQHTFGRACDITTTGLFSQCNLNLANLSNGMSMTSSTIREASRIQLCRRLVTDESFLAPLLSRLNVSGDEISETMIQNAAFLFYPAWDSHPEIISSLKKLELEMLNSGESFSSRWKIILDVLCESPYWEIL